MLERSFSRLALDAKQLALSSSHRVDAKTIAINVILNDSFVIDVLHLVRQAAKRRRVPLVGRALRIVESVLYGLELDTDVELGHGVYFVHTLGTVVGGTSKIGDRVRFYGNNTVGTAKDNGYPIVEDDVQVGCGARILGPIRIGARSVIGANAVVLTDVPPDSVAVGVPARIIKDPASADLTLAAHEDRWARATPQDSRNRM